jgi:hypothetical protein
MNHVRFLLLVVFLIANGTVVSVCDRERVGMGEGRHLYFNANVFFIYIVESLQSHFILTTSHWASGLTLCFPSQGIWVQIPWGDLSETGILLLALSRYIGGPDVIQSLASSPSRCFTKLRANNV